ncbi:MAG TPA: class I SAM-dependent methyltransferase [Planctomycetaceae bacterium]|jgi:2-polyprenyl-3-methyl-5-hydroxy-6-metoxy-1,4-benzoquinol methylase
MSASDLERWNAKYASIANPGRLAADDWLKEQAASMSAGRALELACGLGHNSIWLAQAGWLVDAVDISPIGLANAAESSHTAGANVNWIAADLDEFVPETGAYDLVVVFRFLDRTRLPGIIESALRPGGVVVYETFTTAHLKRPDSHMKNPAFALSPGELPQLFPRCLRRSYAEHSLPDHDVARLVAQKLS